MFHRLICLWALMGCVAWLPDLYSQSNVPPDPQLVEGMQNARSALAQQNFSGAEMLLRPLVEKFPDRPGPIYLLGQSLYGQKRLDEALEAFNTGTKQQSIRANCFYNIACIHSLQNNSDKAIESLQLALRSGFTDLAKLQQDADFVNIRGDQRYQNLFPKILSDDELFVEPVRIIHKWAGESGGDEFGWTARRMGDVDGDQVTDFVTTAPSHQNGSGKIYVYSSRSGKLLHTALGKPGDRLGNSATGLEDVNADNVPDFVAGAPGSEGTGVAIVYSGADGTEIHRVKGTTLDAQFGYEVGDCGDIDGDGVSDFLVGELAGNGPNPQCGRLAIFSGKTASLICELFGERTGDGFGNAAAVAALGNQEFLLAIGAPNAGTANRGQVYVYHIVDSKPTLRFTISGNEQSVNLGQMFISFPGDINRDGTPDVYVSDFSDNTRAPGAGKVVVHCGKSGDELVAIFGTQRGEGLGTSPSDAGDVDGDGIGDLIIGAWQNTAGAPAAGRVYLYNLASPESPSRTITCRQNSDTFGFDACGIGDVDGEGKIDYLLTSAWSWCPNPKTGRVFIIAGE